MKFALAKEHHDYFDLNGFIEFEGLISQQRIHILSKAARRLVANRLNKLPERLSLEKPQDLFLAGRDLWREEQEIRKQVVHLNLAKIASGLVRQRPIRLCLDQWIPPGLEFKNPITFEELTSVQGVLAGAFIALESAITEDETSFFPKEAGNIVFVKPDTVIPYEQLTLARGQSMLMVVYGSRQSVYVQKDTDPLTYYLKSSGYVYGDRLSDNLHPLLLQ